MIRQNHDLLHLGVAMLMLIGAPLARAEETNSKAAASRSSAAVREVDLRGKVVCLPEEMHRLHKADLPTRHEHLYGFKTNDGKYYTLLRTRLSEALFADNRFRERELLLKGRLFPETQIFEPITIRSVRDGIIQDILYYCVICDIEAVAPGVCECCQGPTDLVERPL